MTGSLRHAIVFVSAVFLLLASAAVAQPSEEDIAAAGLLREAEDLLKYHSVPNHASPALEKVLALEKLDQLLTEYPTSSSVPMARFREVVAYLFLGRNDESISLARELIEEYKGTENEILAAWAQCHIGINYLVLNDWEKALAELKKVKKDYGGLPDKGPEIAAQERLGEIYTMWHPPHASGLTGIAILKSHRGDLKGALAAYRDLVKRYPDRKRKIAMAACEIACDWLARSPSDSAEAAQARELALVPRSVAPEETYYWAKAESALASHYLHKARDPKKALAIYESLDWKMPTPGMAVELLYGLATSRRLVGNTAGALAAYERLANEAELTGYAAPACYAAAGCCLALGNDSKAAAWFERLISRPGEDEWRGMGRIRLANLRVRLRDYSGALSLFQDERDRTQADIGEAEALPDGSGFETAARLRRRIASLDSQIQQVLEMISRRGR